MAILRIGSNADNLVDMPDPSELTVKMQDIDSAGSGRSANGTMIRDRVAGGATAKRKLEVEWPPVTPAESSMILQSIKNKFFSVEYPDPYTGANRVGTFYAGDRTAPVCRVWDGEVLWSNISVNFIER